MGVNSVVLQELAVISPLVRQTIQWSTKKKDKKTNDGLQNTTERTKD